jgi:glutamine amidotransferase PdxT
MSSKMKEKFNKYWIDVHGLMAVAAVLDPRYKLHLLNALFLKIHGSESTTMEAVNKVKDILYNLVLEYQDSLEVVATTDGA